MVMQTEMIGFITLYHFRLRSYIFSPCQDQIVREKQKKFKKKVIHHHFKLCLAKQMVVACHIAMNTIGIRILQEFYLLPNEPQFYNTSFYNVGLVLSMERNLYEVNLI